jgi:hypothetical protein
MLAGKDVVVPATVSAFGSAAIANTIAYGPEAGLKAGVFAAAFDFVGANIPGAMSPERIIAHAVLGCVQQASSGGQCGPGAAAAAFGKIATGLSEGLNSIPAQFAVTTVVGGTVSVIGGGKFANGAAQAGFGYLFNQLTRELETSRHAAFGEARRAAGIPGSAVPLVTDEHLYDGNRSKPQFLYDKDGKPLMGRVYTYDVNGRAVVIQEHSVGHMQKDANGKWVMQERGHFNVRDANGNTLPGTKAQYEFKWRVDPMKYFWRRGGVAMPRGGDQ